MSNHNLPPGVNNYGDWADVTDQCCVNGHVWEACMYNELGGGFYVNEDDVYCPECGEYDGRHERDNEIRERVEKIYKEVISGRQ